MKPYPVFGGGLIRQILFILSFLVLFAVAEAKEIVILGDSLSCGSFGKHLFQNLQKESSNITLYCAVSSAPTHWLNGQNPPGQKCQTMNSAEAQLKPCGGDGRIPHFSSILAKHKGARFVVGLGTNSLMSPQADASYRTLAKAIRANGNDCTWIGPPRPNPAQSKGFPSGRIASLQHNLNSFYDSLSTMIDSQCDLLDSREATAPGTPGFETTDGVHRTELAGKDWARQIHQKLSPPGSSRPRPATATPSAR